MTKITEISGFSLYTEKSYGFTIDHVTIHTCIRPKLISAEIASIYADYPSDTSLKVLANLHKSGVKYVYCYGWESCKINISFQHYKSADSDELSYCEPSFDLGSKIHEIAGSLDWFKKLKKFAEKKEMGIDTPSGLIAVLRAMKYIEVVGNHGGYILEKGESEDLPKEYSLA